MSRQDLINLVADAIQDNHCPSPGDCNCHVVSATEAVDALTAAGVLTRGLL